MQTKAVLALLIAAVSAAPSVAPRAETIPVSIFEGDGCNDGPAVSTANVPTDGSCFPISVVIGGETDSFRAETLPAGCTVQVFSDSTCSSVNTITLSVPRDCATFGPGQFIRSARTSGTC